MSPTQSARIFRRLVSVVTRGSCRCGSENRFCYHRQCAGPVGQPRRTHHHRGPARPAPTLTGGGAVVVVAAEAKTTSRSLIAISDVESVFNDEIVKEWARTLKPPADADIARFAQSIRSSAINFLKE